MNWVSAAPPRKFSWRDKGILNLADIDEFADRSFSYLLELFLVYNHGKTYPGNLTCEVDFTFDDLQHILVSYSIIFRTYHCAIPARKQSAGSHVVT